MIVLRIDCTTRSGEAKSNLGKPFGDVESEPAVGGGTAAATGDGGFSGSAERAVAAEEVAAEEVAAEVEGAGGGGLAGDASSSIVDIAFRFAAYGPGYRNENKLVFLKISKLGINLIYSIYFKKERSNAI